MTGTFAGYLIDTKVITIGDLGRLSVEYREYRTSRDWTIRMFPFASYLETKFPTEYLVYTTYCRLVGYNPTTK